MSTTVLSVATDSVFGYLALDEGAELFVKAVAAVPQASITAAISEGSSRNNDGTIFTDRSQTTSKSTNTNKTNPTRRIVYNGGGTRYLCFY